MENAKQAMIERFLRYVKVYTTADPTSDTFPSTARQLNLAKILLKELQEMGLVATLNDYGYVYATLPSNIDKTVPVVGFVAHMDTAPDLTGENVNPQIIEDYDGQVIPLGEDYELNPKDFPSLLRYRGNTLITTDGTTLLGADDKAGIAEIMEAIQYLVDNPSIPHGEIKIGFTPDEEIGKGTKHFDVEGFGADFAYTLDGGEIGELQYENFNAASAVIKIKGRNVHPGDSKNKMINAQEIGMEFHDSLPKFSRPEYTEEYEGFYHLIQSGGTVEEYEMTYIIRDHDRAKFEDKKANIQFIAKILREKYPRADINYEISDTYFNMKEPVEANPLIMEVAESALGRSMVKPLIIPIRGGTDGANLSFMGLPTPNIFAGGHNFHGRFEYIPVESMLKAKEVIINIGQILTEISDN